MINGDSVYTNYIMKTDYDLKSLLNIVYYEIIFLIKIKYSVSTLNTFYYNYSSIIKATTWDKISNINFVGFPSFIRIISEFSVIYSYLYICIFKYIFVFNLEYKKSKMFK